MKKLLQFALAFLIGASAVVAQKPINYTSKDGGPAYAAITVTSMTGLYMKDQPITITYDANKGFTPDGKKNLASEPYIYMHSGAGTAATSFWEVFPKGQEWGKDNNIGKLESVSPGVFSITFKPSEFYTDKGGADYTGDLPSIGCVFRNAAGDGEGKNEGGTDFFIVFPSSTPKPIPYTSKDGGAQYPAITVLGADGMYDQNMPIGIVYNANLGFTPDGKKNLAGEEYIYMHSGAGSDASKFWEIFPTGQEWGKDNNVGKLEKVQPGVFSAIVTPSMFWNQKDNMAYTGPIASFGCVFRNAAGDGEGKADGGADFFIVFPTKTTSVKDGEGVTHNTGVVAPNPVSAITTINYTVLDKPQMMSVAIYDLQGNLVRTLVNEFQQPGNQVVLWNCDNNSGEIVANGMYMYRISSNGFVTSRPIVVQR